MSKQFVIVLPSGRQPLWPSGQSSWLQIQRSGLDSRRYHIFWVQLRRYLEEKVVATGIENREYGRPCVTVLSAKVDTNFADKSGERSVGIVRSRTTATELLLLLLPSGLLKFHRPLIPFIKNNLARWREDWIGYGIHCTHKLLAPKDHATFYQNTDDMSWSSCFQPILLEYPQM
jgi:hypothetical protein